MVRNFFTLKICSELFNQRETIYCFFNISIQPSSSSRPRSEEHHARCEKYVRLFFHIVTALVLIIISIRTADTEVPESYRFYFFLSEHFVFQRKLSISHLRNVWIYFKWNFNESFSRRADRNEILRSCKSWGFFLGPRVFLSSIIFPIRARHHVRLSHTRNHDTLIGERTDIITTGKSRTNDSAGISLRIFILLSFSRDITQQRRLVQEQDRDRSIA